MSPLNISIWQNEHSMIVLWVGQEEGMKTPWSQYSKEKSHPSLMSMRERVLASLSPFLYLCLFPKSPYSFITFSS